MKLTLMSLFRKGRRLGKRHAFGLCGSYHSVLLHDSAVASDDASQNSYHRDILTAVINTG